jgi:hypothetical protein
MLVEVYGLHKDRAGNVKRPYRRVNRSRCAARSGPRNEALRLLIANILAPTEQPRDFRTEAGLVPILFT